MSKSRSNSATALITAMVTLKVIAESTVTGQIELRYALQEGGVDAPLVVDFSSDHEKGRPVSNPSGGKVGWNTCVNNLLKAAIKREDARAARQKR